MTIHKAKGLQSPVVIVPYLRWKMGMRDTLIWASTDAEPFDEAPFLIKASKGTKETYFADDYREEEEMTCIDNLNLLYVAFTRPVERLYSVIAEPRNNNNTAGCMLNQIIIDNDELNKYYHSSAKVFEFGTKEKFDKKENREYESIPLTKYISNDLYQRIVIRKKHESLKLVKDKDFSDKTSWGSLVHKTLSYINKPDDINSAIEKMKQEGLIPGSQINDLLDKLNQILHLDTVKPWFDNDYIIKTEKNIIQPNGDIIRPDRVLIKDDNAIVIDYKTGIEKAAHKTQINKYAKSLTEMGYKSIEKYILYIEGPYVKQV